MSRKSSTTISKAFFSAAACKAIETRSSSCSGTVDTAVCGLATGCGFNDCSLAVELDFIRLLINFVFLYVVRDCSRHSRRNFFKLFGGSESSDLRRRYIFHYHIGQINLCTVADTVSRQMLQASQVDDPLFHFRGTGNIVAG